MAFLHLEDLRLGPGDALLVLDPELGALPAARQATHLFLARWLPVITIRSDHPELFERLRASGAKHVFVAGGDAPDELIRFVREAQERGYSISLLVDALRHRDEHAGQAAILAMLRLGAGVVEVGEHATGPVA